MIGEYRPTEWVNAPSKATPINASNLNKLENGLNKATIETQVALGIISDQIKNVTGAEGKSAYDLWREVGNVGTLEEFVASLVGEHGTDGKAGSNGKDGVDGKDGRDFHLDGNTSKVSELPAPATVTGQYWVTYEFGHLHYSDGEQWVDLGQFAGVKGEKGDKGDTGLKGDKGDKGADFMVTNNPAPLGSVAVMQVDGWKAFTKEEFTTYMGHARHLVYDISQAGAKVIVKLNDTLDLSLTHNLAGNALVELLGKGEDNVSFFYQSATILGVNDNAVITQGSKTLVSGTFLLRSNQIADLMINSEKYKTIMVKMFPSKAGKILSIRVETFA